MNMKSARWLMIVLILSSLLAAVTVDMVNPVLGLISESLQAATKAGRLGGDRHYTPARDRHSAVRPVGG